MLGGRYYSHPEKRWQSCTGSSLWVLVPCVPLAWTPSSPHHARQIPGPPSPGSLFDLFLGWVRWPFLGVPQRHSWPPDCNYITVYKMCLLTCFPNSQTASWVQGLRCLPPGSAYDQAQRCSANMCGHELKDIIILTQWMPFNRNSKNTCQREVSTGCQRFCTEENNLPSWISCSSAWGISRS